MQSHSYPGRIGGLALAHGLRDGHAGRQGDHISATPEVLPAYGRGILIQACASTAGLIAHAERIADGSAEEVLSRTLAENPPVRRTRRMVHGSAAEINIAAAGLPFGAGPHECPGRVYALALATGIIEGSR